MNPDDIECRRDLRAAIEQLRAALRPFAELYGPYRYDGTADDEIVRSAGTLGKDGDRGYAYISVADLRRADELLNGNEQAAPDNRPSEVIIREERSTWDDKRS